MQWLDVSFALCLSSLLSVCTAECNFPEFVRHPFKDGNDRHWLTETKFVESTDVWQSQFEITVVGSEIVANVKFNARCKDFNGVSVPCHNREVVFRKTCIEEMADGKYFVSHLANGQMKYTCMKFIERSRNVIQIWSAAPRPEKDTSICQDHLLTRDEWPWLTPQQEEWMACPFNGGFDLTLYEYMSSEKLCPKIWLPSRLESDCILGDGLVLTFPDAACSPLRDRRLEFRLQCWGSWNEDGFTFVVAGEPRKMAQVVFRFPRDMTGRRELTTKLYFSPVCPTERDGSPSALSNVKQIDLLMNRSEPGICYDDSVLCPEYAADGKCSIQALYQYANFCKRSCGLCNLLPSPRAECRFPEEFYGDWMIFSDRRKERVSIHNGHVTFSSLGEFVCKGKHWNRDEYKMLSYYSNGCRPRYSCMNFVKEYDETLQFRMSKSSRVDASFRLCDFKDDPPPLDGAIRSQRFKTLLPLSKMDENVCGLNGIVRIRTPLQDGRVCQGTLSDWNRRTCSSSNRLKLKLNGICPHKLRDLTRNVYRCVAYVAIQEGYRLLITTDSAHGGKYNCWIIRTYAERMSSRPWEHIYLLDTAQCGTESDLDITKLNKVAINFSIYSAVLRGPPPKSATIAHRKPDQVRRPCDYDELSSDDQPRKPDTTSPRRAKYEEFFDNSDAGSTSESRRKNSSNSLRTHAFVICLLFVYAVLSI